MSKIDRLVMVQFPIPVLLQPLARLESCRAFEVLWPPTVPLLLNILLTSPYWFTCFQRCLRPQTEHPSPRVAGSDPLGEAHSAPAPQRARRESGGRQTGK